ncbi:MAG: hypothetical protein GY821_01790 [Gammaproteobacteria bacterium]|nr:hypothetical protein [Gammaproteobacteria bacterium]
MAAMVLLLAVGKEILRKLYFLKERFKMNYKVNNVLNIWDTAKITESHPYTTRKQVQTHNLRASEAFNGKLGNWLLAPIKSPDGHLISLQGILPTGEKRFCSGASSTGIFTFGEIERYSGTAYFCEGWATGATVFEVTRCPVVCVFSCNNLLKTAQLYQIKRPNIKWIIAADNDTNSKHNIGLETAKAASKVLQVPYAYPTFSNISGDSVDSGSDFNDFYCLYGHENTLKALEHLYYEKPENINSLIDRIDIYYVDDAGNEKRLARDKLLLNIALCCQFFLDQYGDTYSVFWENGARKSFLISGEMFKNWLRVEFYKKLKIGPSNKLLEQAIDTCHAKALTERKTITTFLRFGYYQEKIYIDLCNDKWEVIEIGNNICRVINNPPIYFIRTKSMKEMAVDLTSDIEDFKAIYDLINIPNNQQALFFCWLLSAIKGRAPYGVLNIYGGADSGKTTITTTARDLIDPTIASTRKLTSNERDLSAIINNNAILAFDNTSAMSADLSDTMARLTFSKDAGDGQRLLYTTDTEKVRNRHCPIVINGINDSIDKPDLQSRCLVITPTPFYDQKNIVPLSETEWENKYNQMKAKVRGALFLILSKALSEIDNVEKEDIGRLRDLVRIATAAERATAIFPVGTTREQYLGMCERSMLDLAGRSPVYRFIANLLVDKVANQPYVITASEFNKNYQQRLMEDNEHRIKSQAIGKILNNHQENLYKLGIAFTKRASNGQTYYTFIKSENNFFEKNIATVATTATDNTDTTDYRPQNEQILPAQGHDDMPCLSNSGNSGDSGDDSQQNKKREVF